MNSTPSDKQIQLIPLDDIHPYPNNPRQITQDAVHAVARSIELYGMNQPLVVDSSHILIVGHTRKLALEHLGHTHAPTLVAHHLTPAQADAYRLVDNRTHELTSWDQEALDEILATLPEFPVDDLFPRDLDLSLLSPDSPTPSDNSPSDQTPTPEGDQIQTHVEALCPYCSHVNHYPKEELYNQITHTPTAETHESNDDEG